MKKFLFLAFMMLIGSVAMAENQTVKFTVEPPLVCNNCENKVKENLRFEKGVKAVRPSAKKGEVEVTYDDSKTTIEGLQKGFQKIGYEATPIESGSCDENPGCEPSPSCCADQTSPACCGSNQ